jgi:pimeloyl-ACP methyl ester carboxylesterase
MHRSARSLLAERTPTFREALENLEIPRTYLIGERSLPDFPEGPAPKNGVTVAVVPEAGHLMNVDNPDGFAQAIADAVAESTTGAELHAQPGRTLE